MKEIKDGIQCKPPHIVPFSWNNHCSRFGAIGIFSYQIRSQSKAKGNGYEKNQEKSIRKYIAPVNLNNYKDFAFSLFIPNATQNGQVEVALLTYDEKKIFSTIIDISTISKNQWEEITINLKEYYEENLPTILEFIDKFVLNSNKIYVTDVTIAEQGVNEPLLQLGTDGLYGDAEVIISDEVIERIK